MFGHRPARHEDFAIIAQFPQDAWELFFMHPRGVFPLTAEQLEEVARNRVHPTVITFSDEVIGYCSMYNVTEEECWLGNVIVAPHFRGKGAGKYLIQTMMQLAKTELKVKRFRLVCHNINTHALLYYMRLGFKPFDFKTMKDPDGNDVVGIMMEVELQN